MNNTKDETPQALARAVGSGHFVAEVEVLRGNRRMNTFLRNAGLGLNGAGMKEVFKVDYKPGETVTPERVNKAFDDMRRMSNDQQTDFEILSHKLVALYFIQNTDHREDRL